MSVQNLQFPIYLIYLAPGLDGSTTSVGARSLRVDDEDALYSLMNGLFPIDRAGRELFAEQFATLFAPVDPLTAGPMDWDQNPDMFTLDVDGYDAVAAWHDTYLDTLVAAGTFTEDDANYARDMRREDLGAYTAYNDYISKGTGIWFQASSNYFRDGVTVLSPDGETAIVFEDAASLDEFLAGIDLTAILEEEGVDLGHEYLAGLAQLSIRSLPVPENGYTQQSPRELVLNTTVQSPYFDLFPEAAETVNLAFETYSAHASIGQSAGFMSYEGAVADGTVLRPDAVTSANINETALEISEKDISLAA